MKKIIAAILVIALVMSIATVAFADEGEAVVEVSETVETVLETAEVAEEAVEEVAETEEAIEETEEAIEEVTETEEAAEETVEETEEATEEVTETEEATEEVVETEEAAEEVVEAEEATEETTEETEEKVVATAYATITCSNNGEAVDEGTEIKLVANTDSIEGEILSITWEYTADNGATVHTASSTGKTLTFTATEETVNYLWRAVVTYEIAA